MFLFKVKCSGSPHQTLIIELVLVLYTFSLCSADFDSDRSVLIEFKNSVVDPYDLLSSWGLSHDHCSWQGVGCDAKSTVRSLVIIGSANSTSAIPKCKFSQLYGSLSRIRRTYAHGNGTISGKLLPIIGMLKQLQVLLLPFNELSGEIPKEIWGLQALEVLNLEGNSLTGSIPNEFTGLKKLRVLNLGFNLMKGSIPGSIRKLSSLVVLDLSGNDFHGNVPNGFSIRYICVRGNRLKWGSTMNQILSGSRELLSYEDRANPRLSLSSSDSFSESPLVSVSEHGGSGIGSIAIAAIISASTIVTVLIALLILFFYTRKRMPKSSFQVAGLREIILFSDPGVPLTFDIVVQATANFSTSYCIGHGGFGSTYKVEVSDGVFLAVKRLSVGKYLQGVKQFHAEIKTLGRIRHPNLVTLVGYHASQMEMFLVYNHLPGGNLAKFIQERSEKGIGWKILHKIALGIANAVTFLHDQCVPRILHRDIKPSNILLDNEFNAYLSDFGLSRLLGNSETHATTGVAGTFGYVAPEYAMTCRVSEKSDVYSYGVVLLELISDKKVLDPSFSCHGNGFNIVSWASMLVRQGREREAFASGLWEIGPRDQLVGALNLGVACTVETLSVRPTMKQVVYRLKQLQS